MFLPVLLLVVATVAPAQAPPVTQRAVYQLQVNQRAFGIIDVILEGDDVWIPAADLTRAGLRWVDARESLRDGVRHVAAASVRPRLVVTRDDTEVALKIDAGIASFAQVTSLGSPRSAPERLRQPGGFLNYSATASRGAPAQVATELGISGAHALLRSTLSTRAGGELVRGGTTFSFDHEPTLIRWEAGDTIGRAGAIAGVIPIAGLSISRQFGISSGFVTTSPLSIAGATAVPATAEIYVNGQLVNRAPIEPGTFELRDLIAPTGAGDVQVILRDQFGRVSASTTQFYRSPRVLRPGLQEFRYAVGAPRRHAAASLWGYGGIAFTGEHRAGLTEHVTFGGAIARTPAGAAGEIALALQSRAGELELGAGASRAAAQTGATYSALYAFRARRFGVQASARSRSSRFSEPAIDLITPSPRFESDLAASVTVGHGIGVSMTTAFSRFTESGWRERAGIFTSFGLRTGASVSIGVMSMRDRRGPRQLGLTTTVAISLGGRTSASIGAAAGEARPREVGFSAQRSLPIGPGLGYRVQLRDGGAVIASAQFEGQGSAGRLELRRDMFGGAASESVTASGAIAVIGGGVHLSRPIDDAFALVRVARVGGVRTYLSNQFVGRTNRFGDILVPSLSSYQANRLSIDERDVPLTFDVSTVESVVAPGLRGGSIVTFRVRELRLIEGRFDVPAATDDGGTSSAAADWPDGVEEVTLGRTGTFAFERGASGRHEAHVTHLGQSYRCTIDVPRLATRGPMDRVGGGPMALPPPGVENLGVVPCALETKAGRQ